MPVPFLFRCDPDRLELRQAAGFTVVSKVLLELPSQP